MEPIVIGIIVAAIILVLAFFFASYVKAKPNEALIITGPKKQRIVLGKATLRIPFIERTDSVALDISQVDIKTTNAVPTNEFINIFVDGVGNFRVIPESETIKLAGMLFLKHGADRIKQMVQEVLEGNMREIIGQMKLTQLVTERDIFADKVASSAGKDMAKMGLEIVNLTIQNFSDQNGVIDDLGIDNIEQIRKGASIARAEAARDVEVASSAAKEVANEKRIEAELKIAKQNTDLELKRAELKQKAETQKAYADAAYEIRKQEEQKRINVATQEANIALREKEIEVKLKEVQVEEHHLDAVVKKTAEADKFAKQQAADASLYERTKEAEAELAEKTREAEAVKVTAEAEASRITAIGLAEKEASLARAAGIKAIGEAEALATEKKAEAMKLMTESAVLGMVLDSKLLPEMVAAAAKPMESVDSIIMFGENQSDKLAQTTMNTGFNIMKGMETLGIDLGSILSGAFGGGVAGKLVANTEKETPKAPDKK